MEPNKVQFALYFLISTLLVVFLSAGAMNMVEPDKTIKEYSGMYVREFESHLFYECKNKEHWWVSSGHSTDVDLKIKYNSLKESDSRYVYLRVRAELSELGKFGHFGMSSREIFVHEVLEIKSKIPEACLDTKVNQGF